MLVDVLYEPNITVLDNKYDPETTAMLQAFYSRNHKPIKVRLEEMGDSSESVKKNLEKWYVGYGHKSIGQCGSFTIFIEDVSILAAKVIQDSQLYNGQETSTRYIDFSNQEMHLAVNDVQAADVQDKFLEFYTKHQETVLAHVASVYNLDLSDKIEYKTAKARTFDILRGFLPAGCKTQLSWHTTFTHAADRLVQLMFHPLFEVRQIAKKIIDECKQQYPFAFAGIDKDIDRFGEYYKTYAKELNYFDPDDEWKNKFKLIAQTGNIDCNSSLADFLYDSPEKELRNRPKGVNLPKYINSYGRIDIDYILDYGSFRDIQRHRSCDQLLPILTTEFGFNSWYIESLPYSLQKEAKKLIFEQCLEIEELKQEYSDVELQYIIPMGFNVACNLYASLSSLTYIAEIRTSKTVPPTLRKVAKQFADIVREYVPLYDDQSEDEIDLRRGTQDIVEK